MTNIETEVFNKKMAITSVVLSVLGLILVFATPFQIIALWFGLSSISSKKSYKISLYGIFLSMIGLTASIVIYLNIFLNFDAFVSSDLFKTITYYFFTIN